MGVNTVIAIGSIVINVVILMTVKFNDLKHIHLNVSELKKGQDKLYGKVNGLCQRVSRIEGKLEK